MKYILVFIAIISITKTTVLAQEETEYFTDKGSMWFGGMLSMSSFSVVGSDDRNSQVSLTPIFRYFPVKYFFIGPKIFYSRYKSDSRHNTYGFGGDVGYAKITKDIRTVGYLKTSFSYVMLYRDSKKETDGVELPVSMGVVFPIGDIIWVNIEPNFTYRIDDAGHSNSVSIAIGFSMMRKKSLITVLGN